MGIPPAATGCVLSGSEADLLCYQHCTALHVTDTGHGFGATGALLPYMFGGPKSKGLFRHQNELFCKKNQKSI